MKKLALFALVFGLMLTIQLNAQSEEQPVKKDEGTVVVEEGKPFNTICPVSREEVDENITYEYNGKVYALCCNSCLRKFKADPEKYASRLSEDGKSIKKKNE